MESTKTKPNSLMCSIFTPFCCQTMEYRPRKKLLSNKEGEGKGGSECKDVPLEGTVVKLIISLLQF